MSLQPVSYDTLLQRLSEHFSTSESRYILRCLIEDALHKKQIETDEDGMMLNDLVERVICGEPLQYVTGVAWFFKLQFDVNSSVLIPRPETEELVEWVLDFNDDKALKVLDIGTGSGCIAISLKHMRPHWSVDAFDISAQALATAIKNANKNHLDVNLKLIDIAQAIDTTKQQYDVIVSNPPYIDRNEFASLPGNVVKHEPHVALFAPENDPLFFYKAICEFATKSLKINGSVFVEINQNLANDTFNLFIAYFRYVEMRRDISGNYRMLFATGLKER